MQSAWDSVSAIASFGPSPTFRLMLAQLPWNGRRLAGVLLCGMALTLVGCSQGRVFTPGNLPSSWRAETTTNAKTVDLSRLASPTVPNDEIAAGDVIEISVAAGLTSEGVQSYAVRVDNRGDIEMPGAGRLAVGGLKLPAAESIIRSALIQQQIYRNPNVVVTMKDRKEIEVTVVGAVKKEGTFRMRAGSTGVLNAISFAEGLADDAGTVVEIRTPGRDIEESYSDPAVAGMPGAEHALVGHELKVRTEGPRNTRIDLASLSEVNAGEMALEDGAVVMVERRDPLPISVGGLVRKPDIYDYPVNKNLFVLDAIAMAGGEASLVADKVYVIRRRPNQKEPAVIQVSIRKAKRSGGIDNILLEPGDVVSVEQTAATIFLETVRTVGFGLSGRVF